ncbi:hypothetical protein EJ02DRAFT_455093 [Clathrospora elynae]|uniref:Uncharacterized protein n=1 Tax=Clathrospora elynae TaxID=706981 RepID=A0A6A5SPH9_9PLEO|nr:hypothetical protein EJ02DRAFT_455093 [Clathrospora elynae]
MLTFPATLWNSALRSHSSLTSAKAASILIGPHLYPRYIDWQATIDNPSEAPYYGSEKGWNELKKSVMNTGLGNLPLPAHFRAFMSRVKAELYTQEAPLDYDGRAQEEDETEEPSLIVAKLCGHAMHPGNPCKTIEVCPVCVMRQCIGSLERISRVWKLLGGPVSRPENGNQARLYIIIKRIWQVEKNRWANLVFRCEQFAECERVWEEQSAGLGLGIPDVVQQAKSCTAALTLATQSPFIANGWGEQFLPVERGSNRRREGGGIQEGWSYAAAELPYSPPYSPETAKADPSAGIPSQFHRPPERTETPDERPLATVGAEKAVPCIENGTNLSPSSSLPSPQSATSFISSSIYAPFTPPPSGSPPMTPTTSQSSINQWKSVTFSDNISEHPWRPRKSFNRADAAYQRGHHASPIGSAWIDTSFMGDSLFELSGAEDNEDSEDEDEDEDFRG